MSGGTASVLVVVGAVLSAAVIALAALVAGQAVRALHDGVCLDFEAKGHRPAHLCLHVLGPSDDRSETAP